MARNEMNQLLLPERGTLVVMALITAAMALGGGGTSSPHTEMLLQALFAGALALQFIAPSWQAGLGRVPMAAVLLAALVLLLPIAQLIPLPPSVWQHLPGREVEAQSVAIAADPAHWMPLSMVPARTFTSLLAMICPVLLMIQVSRLEEGQRVWACVAVLGMAMASIMLGVLQLSRTGGLTWSLYTEYHAGYLVGFHANRNAETDVLQIGLLALGALTSARLARRSHSGATWLALVAGLLVFLLAVFLAGSRAGLLLLPVTLTFLLAMIWPVLRRRKRLSAPVLGGALLAIVAAGGLLATLQSVRKVLTRFVLTEDARASLWADTIYAAKQVWPAGGGIGSIVPLLEAAESLEVVDPSAPVRAHNDWLEWVLETGLPGLIVLALIAAILGYATFRAARAAFAPDAPALMRTQVLFAVGTLMLLALHAVVDYPMRSMALASLAALAGGLLIAHASRAGTGA